VSQRHRQIVVGIFQGPLGGGWDAFGSGVRGRLAIGSNMQCGFLLRSRYLMLRKPVWRDEAEWRRRGAFDDSS
jgi:hypothetical protein